MRTRINHCLVPALVFAIVLMPGRVYADTFEFLAYTPPAGWKKEAASDGTLYKRPTGIGLIYFYSSYPSTAPAADEFAKVWRAKVEPTLPGAPPTPQIQRDGDYAVAAGARQVNAQGTLTTITVAAIVGRGRAVGVLTMAAGDDAIREVTTFLDSIDATPDGPGVGSITAGAIEVDFDVPAGYVSQRDGGTVVLKPLSLDRNTPCIYGISSSRPSKGSLETDARAAMLEILPGWQIKSDHYSAMRGTSGDGWPYYWFRTDVQQMAGAQMQYLTAMTMAFPGARGQVNIVWGFGSTGNCMLDDMPFMRLFFSLRPRGWTTDGGKAFAQQLQGTWRNSEYSGMAQYRFLPKSRYEYGRGTSTTFGVRETRTGSVGDGGFTIGGSQLTLTPDARGRGTRKFFARIYDEFSNGVWRQRLALLDESVTPPIEVRYMRAESN